MPTLVIDALPPSLNRLLNMNEYVRSDEKSDWRMRVLAAARDAGIEDAMLPPDMILWSKKKVTLNYYFKTNRRRDKDNYGGKWILDCLTENCLIRDDSPEWVEVTVNFFRDKDRPRTEIVIEEAV